MLTQENDIRMICRDEMYVLSVLWISSPGRLGEIETEKQFRESLPPEPSQLCWDPDSRHAASAKSRLQ